MEVILIFRITFATLTGNCFKTSIDLKKRCCNPSEQSGGKKKKAWYLRFLDGRDLCGGSGCCWKEGGVSVHSSVSSKKSWILWSGEFGGQGQTLSSAAVSKNTSLRVICGLLLNQATLDLIHIPATSTRLYVSSKTRSSFYYFLILMHL